MVSCFVTHGVFPKESWRRFLGQDGAPPLFEKVWSTDSVRARVRAYPTPTRTCTRTRTPTPTPSPLKVWITDSVPATVAAVTSDSDTNACLPPFEVLSLAPLIGNLITGDAPLEVE